MAGLMFWKKKCLEIGFEGVQRGFLLERKGEVIQIHVMEPKTEKALEPTLESLAPGTWRLRVSEAEQRVLEGVQI